jgi:NTE family protein
MKIGLALSGGGVRATVFHLGVLARLALEARLEEITLLSTVSGGSLCAGLVYARNNFAFPSSRQMIEQIVPQARELLTAKDLERGLIWSTLRNPLKIFQSRANLLSTLLQEYWGLTANLSDLPGTPRWLINATCFETAKNWRFESARMGDYVFGYSRDTRIPVSDAVAASCGFPGFIGALTFDPTRFTWFKYADASARASVQSVEAVSAQMIIEPTQPGYSTVHLWDGGVYDNFGLEGVFDIEKGWRSGIDFLIVSDASGRAQSVAYQPGVRALLRIITDVMMQQIRALRARSFLERITNHRDPGAFLEIGNTCADVLSQTAHQSEIMALSAQCQSPAETAIAANTPTMLRRLSAEEFERLFRHGYEVANCTLYAYHSDQFEFIGYGNSAWGI